MFHEGSGKVMNTIPPNDFSFYEMLNEIVQQEPATSLDPELMGPLAAIGIIKGKPFAPDARMKKILTEALARRQCHLAQPVHEPARSELVLLPRLGLVNSLFVTGYEFETPIPMITREGAKPFPPTGYRSWMRARVLLRRHRHHAGDGHAPDRHRLAVSVCHAGCRQELLRRRQDLQGDAAEGHSGGELLVVHALRQP